MGDICEVGRRRVCLQKMNSRTIPLILVFILYFTLPLSALIVEGFEFECPSVDGWKSEKNSWEIEGVVTKVHGYGRQKESVAETFVFTINRDKPDSFSFLDIPNFKSLAEDSAKALTLDRFGPKYQAIITDYEITESSNFYKTTIYLGQRVCMCSWTRHIMHKNLDISFMYMIMGKTASNGIGILSQDFEKTANSWINFLKTYSLLDK